MTLVTLRPDSTVSSSGLAAGNPHTALSDNSDGTTVGAAGGSAATATMTLGTSTLPAGAVTKSLTARIRARATGSSTPGYHKMRLTKADGTVLVDWSDGSWINTGSTWVTKSSPAVAWTGTQADIDGLRTWIHLNAKQANPYQVVAAEAYCDLRYVAQPTVTLDSAVVTLDSLAVGWTYSQPDSDGGAQSQWVVRVFTSAQYGAGGFDASTSAALAEASGSGTTNTATIAGLPDGTLYKVYVRAADVVNGTGLWSPWVASSTFSVTTTRAQVSTVVATAQPSTASVSVAVTRVTAQDAWDRVEVERLTGTGPIIADAAAVFLPQIALTPTTPADVLVIGDSIAEGVGSTYDSTLSTRWVQQVIDGLRADGGVGGGRGYVPAGYGWVAGTAPTAEPTFAGGTGDILKGLGRRARLLSAGGDKVTWTGIVGSAVDIVHRREVGAGIFNVTIDGGAPVAVSAAAAPYAYGGFTQRFTLSPGTHTIECSWVSTGPVYIEGIMVLDSDEAKGMRLWDGTHSGYAASNFAANLTWPQSLQAARPELVIVALGTNDLPTRTAAQFDTDMRTILTTIRAQTFPGGSAICPTVPVLLVHYPYRKDGVATQALWDQYRDKLAAIARDYTACALVDISAVTVPLGGDNLHPTQAGHDAIAAAVLSAIRAGRSALTAGTTWAPVIGPQTVVTNTATVRDLLVTPSEPAIWRARAIKAGGTAGSWVRTPQTPAFTWAAMAIYLRDVAAPTNEILLSGWQPDGFPDDRREIPTASLDVIGRTDPVVVWDVPKYRSGSFRVDVASLAESDALAALLDGRTLMILQPAILGPSMLIQPTGWTRERTAEQIATEGRYVTVDYIQVG